MVGIDTRSIMDMDATIKGKTLTASEVTTIVEDILCIAIDDGGGNFYDIYILTTTQIVDADTYKAALDKTVACVQPQIALLIALTLRFIYNSGTKTVN